MAEIYESSLIGFGLPNCNSGPARQGKAGACFISSSSFVVVVWFAIIMVTVSKQQAKQ